MCELKIRLLGGFQVTSSQTHDGVEEPVSGFGYDKVRALLAYLVVESDRSHPRATLAALLWPEADPDSARASLRKALSTLRKAIRNRKAEPPHLLISRDSVQWNPKSAFWLDVDRLKMFFEATTAHSHLQFDTCEDCAADLEEAAALYRGDFLRGLAVDSLGFEDWSLAIQENLHTQVLSGLHELTQYYLYQGEYALAQKHALRQVELEPFREEAYRALMQSLASTGQRSAALARYERCRGVINRELGVEPSTETQALYQRILAAGEFRPQNLPALQADFLGRTAERRSLRQHFAATDRRLITLVGPGGIGKTTLALQAARENLGLFFHGVFWVPIAPLTGPDQIVPAIIDGLPIKLEGDPETQLSNYLRDKTILLVLDNFEHLLHLRDGEIDSALSTLNQIMQDAPHVQLLITSRERLGLRAEWVIQVNGLPYAEEPASADRKSLQGYAAVQLFMHRARQIISDFPESAENILSAAQICSLLEGVPLGIELAAGWVDQFTPGEIAGRIEADLDFLITKLRDLPKRHRSIRAVFDYSWNLLSADEQAVLCKLAVFEGPFTRRAAYQVAHAEKQQLTAFVHKSFLRTGVDGRLQLHPLLRQFLTEKSADRPEEDLWTRTAHAGYYLHFLMERDIPLTVQFQAAALDEVNVEIADILSAWRWSVSQGKMEFIAAALEGVFIYYWARSQFAQGRELLASTAQVVESSSDPDAHRLLLARLWSRCADFIYWQDDLNQAETLLQRSLVILESLDAAEELAYALELLGRVKYWQGEYQQSADAITSAIEYARLANTRHLLAQALGSMANTICDLSGDYDAAMNFYAQSLEIYKDLDNPFGIAKALVNQGAIYYEQQDYDLAQQRYQESLDLYRELDYAYGISASLNNLAILARRKEDYGLARKLGEESLSLKRETGNRVAILYSLLEVSALEIELGDHAAAARNLSEALQMACAGHVQGVIHNILLGFGELFYSVEEYTRTAELTAWVLSQEQAGQEVLSQGESLYEKVSGKLDPAALSAVEASAREEDLYSLREKIMGSRIITG